MKPSDNEIEMLAAGFAIQHKNGLIRFAHALLDKYAPQASAEDVRNAALEQAARLMDQTSRSSGAELIRALKTQADKDGCTCPSGDGSLRHPCPAHPKGKPPAPSQPTDKEQA